MWFTETIAREAHDHGPHCYQETSRLIQVSGLPIATSPPTGGYYTPLWIWHSVAPYRRFTRIGGQPCVCQGQTLLISISLPSVTGVLGAWHKALKSQLCTLDLPLDERRARNDLSLADLTSINPFLQEESVYTLEGIGEDVAQYMKGCERLLSALSRHTQFTVIEKDVISY